jgi:hypothetical protein
VAKSLSVAGQPGVAYYGDENYPVETIGLGTGTICDPLRFADLKPGIEESIRTWIQTYYATDSGKPLITSVRDKNQGIFS